MRSSCWSQRAPAKALRALLLLVAAGACQGERRTLPDHPPPGTVVRVDSAGVQIVVSHGPDRPLDWRAEEILRIGDGMDPELLERILDDHSYPPTLPLLSDLMVDQGGHLWIREFQFPFSDAPPRWVVIDRDGRYLGEIELPDGFSLFQIGGDFILGAGTDELGVEYARPEDRPP